jgi:hypothetical protein
VDNFVQKPVLAAREPAPIFQSDRTMTISAEKTAEKSKTCMTESAVRRDAGFGPWEARNCG